MEALAPEIVASTTPDINLFVLQTGRLPKLGDSVPPWEYRGWLLYLVQLADSHPDLPDVGHIISARSRPVISWTNPSPGSSLRWRTSIRDERCSNSA
jgi:hypothetical protein